MGEKNNELNNNNKDKTRDITIMNLHWKNLWKDSDNSILILFKDIQFCLLGTEYYKTTQIA